MLKALVLGLAVYLSGAVAAPVRPSEPISNCAAHLPYGQPAARQSNTTLICREGYALEYDNSAKAPIWVSYVLTPAEAIGCYPRRGFFTRDPSIQPEFSTSVDDFRRSDYDIGHLASSGDMRWDPRVEAESNLLSNAAPQLRALNRGPWRSLEDQIRAWTQFFNHPLLIYVGPAYSKAKSGYLGANQIKIPIGFYKIVVNQITGEVLAFYYNQWDTNVSPKDRLIDLQKLETITDLKFPLPTSYTLSEAPWPSPTKTARAAKGYACSLPKKIIIRG